MTEAADAPVLSQPIPDGEPPTTETPPAVPTAPALPTAGGVGTLSTEIGLNTAAPGPAGPDQATGFGESAEAAEPAEPTEPVEPTEPAADEAEEVDSADPGMPVDASSTRSVPPEPAQWVKDSGGVSFGFNLAKILGRGEDADPIVGPGRDLGLAGVFDGMGGAGGTEYATPTGSHTGAYLGSRTARDVVETLMTRLLPDPGFDPVAAAAELQRCVQAALASQLVELAAPRSGLRSTLLRALPTTMALVALRRKEADSTGWACSAFWAGDSRGYLLDPQHGLQQITVDDLRDPGDALANLRQDSVLSNAVSADRAFEIGCATMNVTAPFLVLAATDGCFGYLPTPMHFERLLLQTLQQAADAPQWSAALQTQIAAVTGDDAALAVIGVGADFADLQQAFQSRTALVTQRWVQPLDVLSDEIELQQETLDALRERQRRSTEDFWGQYRTDYEHHLRPSEAKA